MIARDAVAVLELDDSDEALVERVRRGDDTAFDELYRRHSRLAVAVAHKILRSPQDSEDAAAEAFTNVLAALRRQVGPREMFRPYLLACVKNTCALRIRQRWKQACTRDRSFADVDPRQDEQIVEGAVAAAAFQAIPARWQAALWMAEVEHLEPAVIADRLDVKLPAAAALVYRARQGFTEAYLAQHLRCSGKPSCVALGPKLAQYVRGTAGTMASRQVESHVEECSACASALSELADVNSSLRSIPAPLGIVAAAGATAAAVSGGSATVATGVGAGWLMKIAAVAALSAAPVFAGGEGSKPLHAASKPSAHVATTHGTFDLQPRPPVHQAADSGSDGGRTTPLGTTDTSTPDDGAIADAAPWDPPAIDSTSVAGEPSEVGLPTAPAQLPAVVVVTTSASPAPTSPTIAATVDSGTTSIEVSGLVAGPSIPTLPSLPSQSAVQVPPVPATASVSGTGAIALPPGR